MGWESSSDTYTELKLEFSSKELAINYAKKKKIDFEIIEPKKERLLKNLTLIIFLNKKCLNFLLKKNGFYGVFLVLFSSFISLVQVQIDVKINEWFGVFYDTLQKALTNQIQFLKQNLLVSLFTFAKIGSFMDC